jgi:hypothetical protein
MRKKIKHSFAVIIFLRMRMWGYSLILAWRSPETLLCEKRAMQEGRHLYTNVERDLSTFRLINLLTN